MPAKATVEAFIAQVISGDHVGAIRDWYHDDAWMQENQASPRQGGREALIKQEAAMMERSQSVTTELLGGPLIEGDHVAIRWRFTFVATAVGAEEQPRLRVQADPRGRAQMHTLHINFGDRTANLRTAWLQPFRKLCSNLPQQSSPSIVPG
jgi:hypothetical protein